MENYFSSLNEAENIMHSLERLMYLTYPILQEKTIALKSLRDLKKAIVLTIRNVLQREAQLKTLKLSNDPNKNLHKFFTVITKYEISPEERDVIIDILKLNKEYKKSVMEFKRKQDIVIMSNELEYHIINEKKLKQLIKTTKIILTKVAQKIRKV
jgi:hypothetical protein